MPREGNSDVASSVIDQLLKHRQNAEEAKKVILENEGEWKKVINRMLTTEDGKFFAKYMLRYLGIFNIDSSNNQIKLIEDNGKRKFYLELIRPYLDVETINLIENQK